MNFAERRKAKRFIGAIQVEFRQGTGITRDYSTDGIYFVTDQLLSLGEQLEFIIKLSDTDPYPHPSGPIRLRCLGEVVRVEPGLKTLGAAVAVTTYTLERDEDRSIVKALRASPDLRRS